MIEKWKTIPGSDHCRISNLGNIKREYSFLDIHEDMEGYFRCSVGGERGTDRIHRFVAEAFVENDDPKNKKFVNHINGDKKDNRAENLEWCTSQHNTKEAFVTGLLGVPGMPEPVIGVEIQKNPGEVRIFKSQCEANKYIGGTANGSEVNKVLNGKRYTTHGWIFRRLSDDSIKNIKELAPLL